MVSMVVCFLIDSNVKYSFVYEQKKIKKYKSNLGKNLVCIYFVCLYIL